MLIFDNSLLKKVVKLYFELKYFWNKKANIDIFANIVNIWVHGVMIDLFLLFPSHLFFTKSNGLQMKWKKQITLVTLKSIFYSCKFSYLEIEPNETDGIFKFIKF